MNSGAVQYPVGQPMLQQQAPPIQNMATVGGQYMLPSGPVGGYMMMPMMAQQQGAPVPSMVYQSPIQSSTF